MKLLPIAMVLCFFASLGASELPVVSYNYNKKVAKPIKTMLDQHISTVETNAFDMFSIDAGVYFVDWLSDYVIKKSSSAWNRLEGAKLLSTAIVQLNKQKQFVVPNKYKYKSPSGQRYVIAQKLENSNKDINLSDVQHITELAVHCGWHDAHRDNFFKTPSGLIAIIDTEKEQFFPDKKNDEYQVMSRMLQLEGKGYTKEAHSYLLQKNLEYIQTDTALYTPHREK
jgi:hypothetical protein